MPAKPLTVARQPWLPASSVFTRTKSSSPYQGERRSGIIGMAGSSTPPRSGKESPIGINNAVYGDRWADGPDVAAGASDNLFPVRLLIFASVARRSGGCQLLANLDGTVYAVSTSLHDTSRHPGQKAIHLGFEAQINGLGSASLSCCPPVRQIGA